MELRELSGSEFRVGIHSNTWQMQLTAIAVIVATAQVYASQHAAVASQVGADVWRNQKAKNSLVAYYSWLRPNLRVLQV